MPTRATLLFLVLTAQTLSAAELYLHNGDKLSGTLVRRVDTLVVIRHPVLGEITVSVDNIARLVENPTAAAQAEALAGVPTPEPEIPATAAYVPFPRPLAQSRQTPTPNFALTPAPSPAATAQGSGSVARAAKVEEDESEDPVHTWLSGWRRVLADTKGSLELGYQSQSGRRETNNLLLRADAEYKRDVDNFRFDWRYYYGEANGSTQTDKKDWSFRWRHELNKRLFTQSLTKYASDEIKQINANVEQSLGLGFAALNSNKNKLNFGLSFIGQYRVIYNYDTGLSGHGEVFEDYTLRVNKRLSLKQEANFQHSLSNLPKVSLIDGTPVLSKNEDLNYRFRFTITLQGKMTETVSLNLRFEHDYDTSVPDRELRSDQRVSTTLGYAF